MHRSLQTFNHYRQVTPPDPTQPDCRRAESDRFGSIRVVLSRHYSRAHMYKQTAWTLISTSHYYNLRLSNEHFNEQRTVRTKRVRLCTVWNYERKDILYYSEWIIRTSFQRCLCPFLCFCLICPRDRLSHASSCQMRKDPDLSGCFFSIQQMTDVLLRSEVTHDDDERS